MGVASLVLGIVSLVFAVIVPVPFVAPITGIVGIILGAISRKNNPEKSGLATGGLVCSLIGTIFSLIVWIACASCLGTSAGLGSCTSMLGSSMY